MSDFIDFNWDGGAMPGLETNDEPFDFSFLDDPAHSGPQFPFDELAVPVAHHASLRTPFVVNDLLVEVVGEPDGNEHQAPSLNEAMSTTAQPSPLPPPRDTGVSDLLRSNTSSGSSSETEFNALETEPQTNEHALVGNKLQCLECHEVFQCGWKLDYHASRYGHRPYICTCGIKYSRFDALSRHLRSKNNPGKHPCPYCKRHRGENSFHRRDHLIQHLRIYHKFEAEERIRINATRGSRYGQLNPTCPHPTCPESRDPTFHCLPRKEQDQTKPFKCRAEYTKHMKDVHNETPFPCRVSGCDRVGAKGFVREKALINHRRLQHPEAPAYTPVPENLKELCPFPNCGERHILDYLYFHVANTHMTVQQRFAD